MLTECLFSVEQNIINLKVLSSAILAFRFVTKYTCLIKHFLQPSKTTLYKQVLLHIGHYNLFYSNCKYVE